MRLPGWLFVIAALFLVAATVICAAGSYGFARQIAVDLANSGVSVAGASFDQFAQSQPTATPTDSPPTATPRPGVPAQPKFDLDPAPSSKPRPEPPPRASSQTTSSTIIMIAVIFGALLLASIL